MREGLPLPTPDRLARYVVDDNGCWLWTGSLAGGRYGKTSIDGHTVSAHVASWAATNGRWPTSGEVVRHTCDVMRCMNPQHLVIGSHVDNMRDRTARGRTARGERQGAARLTVSDITEIRRRHAQGEGCPRLGKAFGVHFSTINRIVRRQSWQHVA